MENEFTFCQKCGEKNSTVNSNCQKCSEPLDSGIQQPPLVQSQYAHPQDVQPQYNQPQYTQPQYVPQYQPQPAPKKKQSGCLIAILVCVGLFFFLIVIGIVFGDTNNNATDSSDTTITTTKKETQKTENSTATLYTTGETINVGDLKVILSSFNETNKIESNNQFIEDVTTEGKFLVVDAKFHNNDTVSRTIDPALLTIIDGEGKRYDALSNVDLMVILGDKYIFLDEINPGMSLTGTFVFEMPQGINEYYMEFSPGFFSIKSPVTVKLK